MKAVALFSSGIDSPVASYLMLKRGVEVHALHTDARPHTDDAGVDKAVDLAKQITKAAGTKLPLTSMSNASFHEAVAGKCNPRYHCILCKRFMYRAAEALAGEIGADCIFTGESLGQVASQTLQNLLVLDESVELPVIRPLIGFDKEDAIKVARDIGTYEISSRKSVSCPFVPKQPSTEALLEDIRAQEAVLDMDGLLKTAVDTKITLI